jgi:hypothetical protein
MTQKIKRIRRNVGLKLVTLPPPKMPVITMSARKGAVAMEFSDGVWSVAGNFTPAQARDLAAMIFDCADDAEAK